MQKRRISVLGSTGSVGSNCLDLIRQNPERFEIVSLSCGSSVEVLVGQVEEFRPDYCSVATDEKAAELRSLIQKRGLSLKDIFVGLEGHKKIVQYSKPDVLLSAMMGTFGLAATLEAVRQQTPVVGIANKEILVMGGRFILEELKQSKTALVPVDSEHSAIFQCLMGNDRKSLKKIYLTASGGPFRTWPVEKFKDIRLADALKHPNWVMGQKITVDSASMMNKGLEYIEAVRLFDLDASQIEIVIHPQSLIHSMVEFVDHSIMAQLGVSDMRIPISLSLSYPQRLPYTLEKSMNFKDLGQLTFEQPDFSKFPCLALAIEAESLGPQGSVIINAANEELVRLFLNEEISFVTIPEGIQKAMKEFKSERVSSLQDAIQLDQVVKNFIVQNFEVQSSAAQGVL